MKDFHKLGAEQGCYGFDRLVVDRKAGEAFLSDSHSSYWKVGNWAEPKFVALPIGAASLAIDSRNRWLYANRGGSVWAKEGGIARFHLDQKGFPPAKAGKTGGNVMTEKLISEWVFEGNTDLGFAVAPNGNIAGLDQKGQLNFFHGSSEDKVPWAAQVLIQFDPRSIVGCVQFDRAGNLYVGCRAGGPPKIPPLFKDDGFASQTDRYRGAGRIVKYAPTGDLKSGNLFPKPPDAPAKVYDVNLAGFDSNDGFRQFPRFRVDEYGRICFPTTIDARVTLMDNAGNEILHFGTWGNRDSIGGLPGDLVPTKGIPMGLPNSVDATDDYIYVGDMVGGIRRESATGASRSCEADRSISAAVRWTICTNRGPSAISPRFIGPSSSNDSTTPRCSAPSTERSRRSSVARPPCAVCG